MPPTNSARSKFQFKSKTGVGGITKVLLKIKAPEQGLVQFTVAAKDADFPISPDDLPLALSLTLSEAAGQCAEHDFELAPHVDPACASKSGGDKILCR